MGKIVKDPELHFRHFRKFYLIHPLSPSGLSLRITLPDGAAAAQVIFLWDRFIHIKPDHMCHAIELALPDVLCPFHFL